MQLWNNLGNESQRALENRNKSEENYVHCTNKQISVNNTGRKCSVQSRSNSKAMNLWSTFSNCGFILSLHCAISSLTLLLSILPSHTFTHTERVFKSITLCLTPLRVQSDLVDEKNWLYSWTNISIICEKPQLSNSQHHSEDVKRKEINHLENLWPLHRMLCVLQF